MLRILCVNLLQDFLILNKSSSPLRITGTSAFEGTEVTTCSVDADKVVES